MAVFDSIRDTIAQMTPVTLASIDGVSLLNRVDTKFVLHETQLLAALAAVADTYQVLEIDGARLGRYASTYFDTPDFAMYYSHHNGIRARYKVRCRTYVDSSLVFLEIKEKTNKERTLKTRIPLPEPVTSLAGIDTAWLPPCFPYDVHTLRPVLWNRFDRMTLVNLEESERVTIDVNLSFGENGVGYQREGLVVAEVKQPRFNLHSPFGQAMHRGHIRPTGFSKFCIAAAHLHNNLKHNRFKPLLLQLDRMHPLRGCHDGSE